MLSYCITIVVTTDWSSIMRHVTSRVRADIYLKRQVSLEAAQITEMPSLDIRCCTYIVCCDTEEIAIINSIMVFKTIKI